MCVLCLVTSPSQSYTRGEGWGQSFQLCVLVPQETFLDFAKFPQFYQDINGYPREATAINPQLCCLNSDVTSRLPQLLLNNEFTSMRLHQLDSMYDVIQATSRKCPHFASHFTLLVPHSPIQRTIDSE